MKILKFGGTSVGTPQRLRDLISLVNDNEPKVVVLSAMAGTTDLLVEVTENLKCDNKEAAAEIINKLENKYYKIVAELFKTDKWIKEGNELIKTHFNYIKNFVKKTFTIHQEKAILAQGELLSTALFHYLLKEENIKSTLLPALNFMRIDRGEEPDEYYIKENIEREFQQYSNENLFITQGFICRNAFGEIDNLKRGGSDYTASLIAAAINADEVQIWTDIDGFHNNDPRFVENTKVIRELSFDEAAELAYFGAKILHPSSVRPCKLLGIPVRLKNTMNPTDKGTIISLSAKGDEIKAIAAKDNIAIIKVKSDRMLLAYGFLRKVFEVFELYKTSVDVITTSEVAVSVTIDNFKHLEDIKDELKRYGTVHVDYNQAIICIVGDLIAEKKGLAKKIFEALEDIPVRMISYGGSSYNITVLINKNDKVRALRLLNENLFNNE
jgi:aspartate kinase